MKPLIRWLVSGLIVAALGTGLYCVSQRVGYESKHRQVMTLLSLKDAQKLASLGGLSLPSFLAQLGQMHLISAVVLDEESVDDWVSSGKVTLSHGADVPSGLPEATYITIPNAHLYAQALQFLVATFGAASVHKEGAHTLSVLTDFDTLKTTGVGLSPEIEHMATSRGFSTVIRLKNSPTLSSELIRTKFHLFDRLSSKMVLCEGPVALGYPHLFSDIRKEIVSRGLTFGVIEFNDQVGARELALPIAENIRRVHSITEPEIASKYTPKKAIIRFVRAAKERNMTLLFVHPFLSTQDNRPLMTFNLDYFSSLKKALSQAGFDYVSNLSGTPPQPSIWQKTLIALGALLLLCLDFPGLILPICVLVGLGSLLDSTAVSVGTAWMIAATYPAIAILALHKSPSLKQAIRACGMGLLGGLWISVLLASPQTMLGLSTLPGIKAAFVIPVLWVGSVAYVRHVNRSWSWATCRQILDTPLRLGSILAGGLVLACAVFYLIRSGNSGAVSGSELNTRDFLETLFYMRPRTKEFLIGYPFLVLWVMGTPKKWFFLPLATVALVSMINSFCHLHTPFILTLYRCILGVGLGGFVGVVYRTVYHFFYKDLS